MIEFLTTPKVAVLFAIAITVFLDIFLSGFLYFNNIPLLGALAFCTPLSIVAVAVIMVLGAFVFHAHKKLNT